MNETHNPSLTSWVSSANDSETDFPIQNLPFGVFKPVTGEQAWRGGVAIGDQILDLAAVDQSGVFKDQAQHGVALGALDQLNELMNAGPTISSALRKALSDGLASDSPSQAALAECLVPRSQVQMRVPAQIGDYTDMYTSIHHASNIGKLFRPDNPLMPNFQWLPVGYHGRASSIDVSGQRFPRPSGQTMPPGAQTPSFGPSKRMDYELEIGIWVGQGNELGSPVELDRTNEHVFGLCLLNDWSARDIQAWEYQPLGPFLAKNFASTISPWMVTLEALEPFRVPWTRPSSDPQPLPYLESEANRNAGGFDIQIETWLSSEKMRTAGDPAHRLSRSSFRHSYWSIAQMVAHHTVGGCNLRAGDLIGSGTQSGPSEGEAAALIEITKGGKEPVTLSNGEQRTFLEDNDSIELKGWCEAEGFRRIGFGGCEGMVLPAR